MDECVVNRKKSLHYRRCFITGEYCTKLKNIELERDAVFNEGETISAFVLCDFSEMSDVVYKWKIQPYIEKMTKYFYYDKNGNIHCIVGEDDEAKKKKKGYKKVEKIEVKRADNGASPNYLICNNICQEMQIADLIVVDVSYENANVFYELGLAVAMGKMILPMCYSESFYKRNEVFDFHIKEQERYNRFRNIAVPGSHNQNHIDCFSWRRKLYEYFGLMYRQKDSFTKYLDFDEAKNPLNRFSDVKYGRLPYNHDDGDRTFGNIIYDNLKKGYNSNNGEKNTLIIYNLDRIFDEDKAGSCIINFYNTITRYIDENRVFCGDRVGELVHGEMIYEEVKDSKFSEYAHYNLGEIIHVGVNEATFDSMKMVNRPENIESKTLQEHIGNRGMIIFSENPFYIDRLKDIQVDITGKMRKNAYGNIKGSKNAVDGDTAQPSDEGNKNAVNGDTAQTQDNNVYVLFHVICDSLKYANELVADITSNSVVNLFWLGIAHGLSIDTITVQYRDRNNNPFTVEDVTKKNTFRPIFDIAGLWTVQYFKDDTKEFKEQLLKAQMNILKTNKLLRNGSDCDKELLESYYRKVFWNSLLKYNRLFLYMSKTKGDKEEETIVKMRDLDTLAELSFYLSKRTAIGEYEIKTVDEGDNVEKKTNYVCIGSEVKTSEGNLSEYEKCKLRRYSSEKENGNDFNIIYKGFYEGVIPVGGLVTKIEKEPNNDEFKYITKQKTKDKTFNHIEYGQLLIWREDGLYRVALNGCSGPATHGLVGLLIGKERKNNVWKQDDIPIQQGKPDELEKLFNELKEPENYNLLYKIQNKVRKDVIDIISKKTKENKVVKEEETKKPSQEFHTELSDYLHELLYVFFLPLIGEREIQFITHSVQYYFSKKKYRYEVIQEATKIISDTLKSFEGLCIMVPFGVITDTKQKTGDKRKLVKIGVPTIIPPTETVEGTDK